VRWAALAAAGLISQPSRWSSELQREHPYISVAIDVALDGGMTSEALRLVGLLGYSWTTAHGAAHLGTALRVLDHADGIESARLLGRALTSAANLGSLPEDFAQDLNPKLAAEIAAQQRPSSLALFVTPSGPGAWHALPSWYVVSAHDRAIDPDLQRFMAQRAGSTTVEFAAASHVGGLTHYRARFVKLIEQAIDATAS
jgi:hypothetical protein